MEAVRFEDGVQGEDDGRFNPNLFGVDELLSIALLACCLIADVVLCITQESPSKDNFINWLSNSSLSMHFYNVTAQDTFKISLLVSEMMKQSGREAR